MNENKDLQNRQVEKIKCAFLTPSMPLLAGAWR
jgi:hypothetical protein